MMHLLLLLTTLLPPLFAADDAPVIGLNIEVSVTGYVTPLPILDDSIAARPFCFAPTHALEIPEDTVYLWSNKVDLTSLLGQNVRLHGLLNTDCGLITVDSVEAAPATLAICGTPALGCQIRLRSGPGGLSQHWLFVAPGGGFLPLNPEKGSLLLGEPMLMIGASGAGQFGDLGAAFNFTLPNNPILIGVPIHFQAASRKVAPFGPIRFSNAVQLEIFGPLPVPCVVSNC